jgi:hypothetical protein
MKKKLLIVAGAGASVEFGMPSVAKIDALFQEWAMDIMPLVEQSGSLYSWVRDTADEYYRHSGKSNPLVSINFERTLFTIQTLSRLFGDKSDWRTHHFAPFVDLVNLPKVIGLSGNVVQADHNELATLFDVLLDKLVVHFRSLCAGLLKEKPAEIEKLKSLLSILRSEFDIGIVNLNYDNVLLSACPELVTGFDSTSGDFKKDIVYRESWNFIYHLHGSIHFDMKGKPHDLHQVMWNNDLTSYFSNNAAGRNSLYTVEGNNHPNSSIITGLDKSNQLLREPFITYYSELVRKSYLADALLFIGYGFGDNHLNSTFNFNRFDGRRRPVVVIDYSDKEESGLSSRYDAWAGKLFQAIPGNIFDMRPSKGLSRSVAYYRIHKIFERSSNPDLPLSVWYDGLMSACEQPVKVLQELSRQEPL